MERGPGGWNCGLEGYCRIVIVTGSVCVIVVPLYVEVATTVMLVVVLPLLETPPPEPQPVSWVTPKTPARSIRPRSRLRRFRNPKKQRARAKVAPPGMNGFGPRRFADVEAASVIVTTVVMSFVPVEVRVAGENAQLTPAGAPVQEKETVPRKLAFGAMVMSMIALLPGVRLTADGLADAVKLGARLLTV